MTPKPVPRAIMDLDDVEGLAPPMVRKLREHDIHTVEALADAAPAHVATVTGLSTPAARLVVNHARDIRALHDIAGDATPRLYARGVHSVTHLATATMNELHDIPDADTLRDAARTARPGIRVVLVEGLGPANVFEGDTLLTSLPVRPVHHHEEWEAVATEAEAVLLVPGHDDAILVLEGIVTRAPLFQHTGHEEQRIRIKDVRVRFEPPAFVDRAKRLLRRGLDRLPLVGRSGRA